MTSSSKTYDASIKSPFSMGVFGSRNSGKTFLTCKLILSNIIQPPISKVVWMYKSFQQKVYDNLQNAPFGVEFLDHLPDFEQYKSEKTFYSL